MIMITHAIARYCWRLQFGTSGHSPQCSEKALRTSRLRCWMKKWFTCLRGHISLSWDRQTDRSVNVTFIAVLCRRRYSLGLRRALVMARFFLKIPHHLVSQLHHERTAERRKLVAGRKEGRKEISASRRFLFEMGTVLLIKKTMGFSKKSWLISVTMANQKLCCFSLLFPARWASILPEAASEERSGGKVFCKSFVFDNLDNHRWYLVEHSGIMIFVIYCVILQTYATVTKAKIANPNEREPARTIAEQVCLPPIRKSLIGKCFNSKKTSGAVKRDNPRKDPETGEAVNVFHLPAFTVALQQTLQQVAVLALQSIHFSGRVLSMTLRRLATKTMFLKINRKRTSRRWRKRRIQTSRTTFVPSGRWRKIFWRDQDPRSGSVRARAWNTTWTEQVFQRCQFEITDAR